MSVENTPMAVGRRGLLRAGAATAWTVPLVVTASPAHAVSCSGGTTGLTATVLPDSRTRIPGGSPVLSVLVEVCNTGQAETCALFATATAVNGSQRLISLSVGDWPPVSITPAGVSSLTVSAPASGQLAAGACATYPVTFTIKGGGVHTVDVTFQSSNGGLASVSIDTTSSTLDP